MKTIIPVKLTLLLLSAYTLLFSFSACKKSSQDEQPSGPGNNQPTGTLMFHLHTNIDSNEVEDYDVVYTTAEGRKVSFSLAQLYISGIQLVKLDGSTYDLPASKVLQVQETEIYQVGDVPVGNYKSVRFKVGLDATTNQSDPVSSPDSAILNRHEMWFGSTAQPDGYVFVNLQGKIDTTAAANGTVAQMQPFVYKIGTNANYRQVTLPDQPFTVVQNQAQFVHIVADYYRLLAGVQFNQAGNLSLTTPVQNAGTLGTLMANNLPSMFMYE